LQAHHRLQEEGQVKEFKGKILKIGGKFVLEESSNGGNCGTYLLDDQATAKKYACAPARVPLHRQVAFGQVRWNAI
jgi:hypothetical protein